MQEIISSMILASIRRISTATKIELLQQLGSATAILQHRHDIKSVVPDATENLSNILKTTDLPEKWAEQEYQFCKDNNIQVLHFNDDKYPKRLRECVDAPVVLYYKGNADLNSAHVINIIGTRKCTAYGNDCIRKLMAELSEMDKNILVVSGLAYGVDICAHRNALSNGMNTIGVLAHGLDELYPSSHRETAAKMINQGGLLTEYPTRCRPDKKNFVSRNRIVAGMADATILVESASKGGGLITANIAKSYSRDVFAYPGRIGDIYSEGCNNLIRDNGAAMITSAEDLIQSMNWETIELKKRRLNAGIECQLFVELTDEEQKIVDILQQNNDMQLNMIMAQSGISIGKLTSILFEMEMKGLIRALAGGVYHLL